MKCRLRFSVGLIAVAAQLFACGGGGFIDEVGEGEVASSTDAKNDSSQGKPSGPVGTLTQKLDPWSVALSFSATGVWTGQSVTLTATANQDVGPTPYYIAIYEGPWDVKRLVGYCGSGTTCVKQESNSVGTHWYSAKIVRGIGPPPTDVQATSSGPSTVFWGMIGSTTFTASATTVSLGASVNLTATNTVDITVSPYYFKIFDATTGVLLAQCATGTSCSTSVAYSSDATHKYVAYLTEYGDNWPVQANDIGFGHFVTWASTGFQISMSSQNGQVTATTNNNVGPTPYWIQIFDFATGTRMAVCGTGTTCSWTPSSPAYQAIGFVSSNTPAFLPTSIQANSSILAVDENPN